MCIKERSYKNTYGGAKDKSTFEIKHMRNAVEHDRIMIISKSAGNRDIIHIRFQDASYFCNGSPPAFRNGRKPEQQILQKKVIAVQSMRLIFVLM